MTQIKNILCVFALAFSLLFASQNAFANLQNSNLYPPVNGFVFYVALPGLLPDDCKDALTLLMRHKYTEAKKAIDQKYQEHPKSLALFVAEAQLMDSSGWKYWIDHYRKKSNSLDDSEKFKYATYLFYYWGLPPGGIRSDSYLREAQFILRDLWLKEHEPIVGLMLEEISCIGAIHNNFGTQFNSPDKEIKTLTLNKILDTILYDTLGKPAYAKYLASEKLGWKLPPPPVSLIPRERRKLSIGLVAMYRSFYGESFSMGTRVNGKMVWKQEAVSPERLAAQNYFKQWFEDLFQYRKNNSKDWSS
jgi:hypothetical protein